MWVVRIRSADITPDRSPTRFIPVSPVATRHADGGVARVRRRRGSASAGPSAVGRPRAAFASARLIREPPLPVPVRVERIGDGAGEPELAVVGAIHGDEPCGAHAVEGLIDDPPPVERPVKLIVANERALERGVRYVDADLNRAFPGAPGADTHEGRLAHALRSELVDCTAFSIHSTRSHDRPFAVVNGRGPLAEAVCPYLSVEAVVDAGEFTEGRLVDYASVVEVEAGLQGSPAAARNAASLAREFLGAVGALPAGPRRERLPVYRLRRLVPKRPAESYGMLVSNFERVDAGEPYATVDGEELVADESFYPVLMSAYGYETQLGYAADLVGSV